MTENIKISIITVVYNSVNLIGRTIKSVINQSYANIEYIIIDGGSNDGTLNIIKKYENKIQTLISEPDNGLYDAMNKGIEVAQGEYLLFINSGDELFNNTIIELIFNNKEADIYYGDTIITNEDREELGLRRLRPPKKLTLKSLKKGMLVCHQSLVVKKSVIVKFNQTYTFSADFDWIIETVKKAGIIINTNTIISKFLEGGRTSNTVYKGLLERFSIMKKHYGFLPAIMHNLLLIPRFIGYLITKRI